MVKQLISFKVDEEDYEKMRIILSDSEHHLMGDLVVDCVLTNNKTLIYKKDKEIFEKEKEINRLNKIIERLKENAKEEVAEDLINTWGLSQQSINNLTIQEENKILRRRLQGIKKITDSVLYRNVRLSKQYIIDIQRMTQRLEEENPYY